MNLPLILHLAGAAVVAVLLVLALVARIFRIDWYRPLALSIGVGGAYQLVTGSVLGYVSHGSIVSVCSRFAVYLAVLVAAEIMLYAASAAKFPTRTVVLSFATGLASVVVFVLVSTIGNLSS